MICFFKGETKVKNFVFLTAGHQTHINIYIMADEAPRSDEICS